MLDNKTVIKTNEKPAKFMVTNLFSIPLWSHSSSKFVAVFVPLAVKVGDTEYQVTPRYTLTSIHTRFGAHRNQFLAFLQDKNKHQKLPLKRTVVCDWFVIEASLVTLQLGYLKDRLARQS